MKRKHFFILIGACVLIILFYLVTQNPTHTKFLSYDKSVLEVQKLQIDISNLQKEQKYYMFKFWLSNLTPIIALGTLIWTVYAGFNTINNQTKQKKKDAISSLLTNIVSDSPDLRLGSARGLSLYVDDALNEIISVTIHEQDNIIRDELEKLLNTANELSIKKLLELNSSTIEYRIILLGKMKYLSFTDDFVYAVTRIPIDILHTFIKIKPFNVTYEYSKNLQVKRTIRMGILNKHNASIISQEDIFETVINDAKISALLAEITGRVIAKAICQGKKLSLPSSGADLSETTLYSANLSKTIASNIILINCLMRHARLEKSAFSYSFFDNSDLYGAFLNKSTFNNVSFKGVHLRKCIAKKIKLSDCIMDNSILSEGILSGCSLANTVGKSAEFRATDFKNSAISSSKFSYCEFQDGKFSECSIEKSNFLSCKFIEADFKNSTLTNVQFNGSDLRGAKFNASNLTNIDFSGANIDNADFRGVNISTIDFSKSIGTPKIDVVITTSNSTDTNIPY